MKGLEIESGSLSWTSFWAVFLSLCCANQSESIGKIGILERLLSWRDYR